MKIQNQKTANVNFGALHIASTKNFIKGTETPVEIYKIHSQNDIEYLNNLKKLKIKDYMPNMDKNHLEIWQTIFNMAVNQAKNSGILAFCHNKPCGIINFCLERNSYKLKTICALPTAQETKIPNTGNTLFSILINDFLKSDASRIELNAITNGPFSAVSKYMALGFKQVYGENGIVVMRSSRDSLTNTYKKLTNFINIKFHENPQDVDLKLLESEKI